jgi:hypothetical protein
VKEATASRRTARDEARNDLLGIENRGTVRGVQSKADCETLSRREDKLFKGALDPIPTVDERRAKAIVEHAGCGNRTERARDADEEVRQLDTSRELQLDRDPDWIPWEIGSRRFTLFVEQPYARETRYSSSEHAWGIEGAQDHARLEITIEDVTGPAVGTHTPLFKPDGSWTHLFGLSHVVSGHQDGFPFTEQGGNEPKALLAE